MKALVTATVILALALAALVGGVARESRSATPTAPAPAPVEAESLRSGFAPGDTQALLLRLQADVASRPDDAHSVALLGLAYAQRARETGDAAYVTRADRAFRRAVRLEPEDFEALTGLGGVALTRHRFRDALALGRRAIAAAPGTAAPYGVLGDALLELGRYDAAFAAFDRMAALKPNTSSYARVSYARELRGDVAAAIDAMELALDAAAGRPEAYAWTAVELGKLHWSVGRVPRAASFYRLALAARPGFAPALDALARFEAAQGRLGRAVALQRRAVEAVPLPGYVAQLGDLLSATGRKREAREQYGLVAAIEKIQAANGSRIDLESALYRTDRGIRLAETLELARLAHVRRPSIAGDDVLAWALTRNGRCGEARRWSQRSLRLGTRDASFFFHRGMIERCLGRDADARRWFRLALDTNPHFSLLWSPTARRYAL
jgi:tetratricopeptide (TPR) repeat protein